MALVHLNFFSQPLTRQSALFAVLPQGKRDLRVVYLLHGLSDDYTIWQRRTAIERYADRHGILVVMPDGGRGFYTDARHLPGAYESHLLAVIDLIDATFPTAARRGCRGIGGLSMGGYGAMKLGLKHPDRFASVVSHSGTLDIVQRLADRANPELPGIYGTVVDPAEDCFALAARPGPKPAIRFDCGVDDFLIAHNRRFHAHLDRCGITHEYQEFPGGHSWDYWDEHVVAALDFHVAVFAREADGEPVGRASGRVKRSTRTAKHTKGRR